MATLTGRFGIVRNNGGTEILNVGDVILLKHSKGSENDNVGYLVEYSSRQVILSDMNPRTEDSKINTGGLFNFFAGERRKTLNLDEFTEYEILKRYVFPTP